MAAPSQIQTAATSADAADRASECAPLTGSGGRGSWIQSHEEHLLEMQEQKRELKEFVLKQQEINAGQDRNNAEQQRINEEHWRIIASMSRDIAGLQRLIPSLAELTARDPITDEQLAAALSSPNAHMFSPRSRPSCGS